MIKLYGRWHALHFDLNHIRHALYACARYQHRFTQCFEQTAKTDQVIAPNMMRPRTFGKIALARPTLWLGFHSINAKSHDCLKWVCVFLNTRITPHAVTDPIRCRDFLCMPLKNAVSGSFASHVRWLQLHYPTPSSSLRFRSPPNSHPRKRPASAA